MKVYEIAKEQQVESKEIVAICAGLGFEVKPQNKLNPEQVAAILAHFGTTTVEEPVAEKPKKAKTVKKAKTTETKPTETAATETAAVETTAPVAKTVAYVVTECEPFTTLGDLGTKTIEAVRSTTANGDHAVIVMPKYSNLSMGTSSMEWVMDIPVYVGSEMHRASIHRLTGHGVTYVFVGNEFFFDREDIYGYDDDLARFSFFNRAALNVLPYLGIKADEIQLSDWHTSIFSLIQKVQYKDHPYYSNVKTILNINDLMFQGWYGADSLPNVLGIAPEYYHNGLTRMGDSVNILKSGIETADMIRLTEKSQEQMSLSEMVESGISYVVENKLQSLIAG